MINKEYSTIYFRDSVDKQLKIYRDDGVVFDNSMLHMEEFSLEESLFSGDRITYGSCEASCVKFRVSNVAGSSIGKWLTITQDLEGIEETVNLGKFKVESDTPTADRSWRDIVAYDVMKDIIDNNAADWYNNLSFPMTLLQFRNAFFRYLGVECVERQLVNDGMTLQKNVLATEISGRDIAQAICEINGVFGHINRDGKFDFIELKEENAQLFPANNLYPRNTLYPIYSIEKQLPKDDLYPAEDIYPTDMGIYRLNGSYISCEYEDFITEKITGVNIKQIDSDEDLGTLVGTNENVYKIQGNFLVYGMTNSELQTVGANFLSKVSKVRYRPFKARAVGNPLVEIGDPIKLNTEHEIIRSIVSQRTLSGIQGLFDDFSTVGVESFKDEVNSVGLSYKQLRGRVNVLKRDQDATVSELKNFEDETDSRFEQTAESITMQVNDAKDDMHSEIVQTAGEINLRVTNEQARVNGELSLKIAKGDNGNDLKSVIEGMANTINFTATNMFTVTSDNLKISKKGFITAYGMRAEHYIDIAGRGLDPEGTPLTDRVFLDSYDGDGLKISKNNHFRGDGELWCGDIYCNKITAQDTIYSNKEIQSTEIRTSSPGYEHGVTITENGLNGGLVKVGYWDDDGTDRVTEVGKYVHTKSVQLTNPMTTTLKSNLRCIDTGDSSTSGYLRVVTDNSSKRWKHDISTDLTEEMNPHKLYDLPVVQFKYNLDHLEPNDQRYNKALIGFIAEDVDKIYPQACDYDVWGLPENWQERYMIPPMLKLIQEQHEEIEKLKERVSVLENGGK